MRGRTGSNRMCKKRRNHFLSRRLKRHSPPFPKMPVMMCHLNPPDLLENPAQSEHRLDRHIGVLQQEADQAIEPSHCRGRAKSNIFSFAVKHAADFGLRHMLGRLCGTEDPRVILFARSNLRYRRGESYRHQNRIACGV